jgi:adenylate cyclase class 2
MREIELKAHVRDKTQLLHALAEQHIELRPAVRQEDLVFAMPGWQERPHDRFWLRIRVQDDGRQTFTLKKSVTHKHDSIEYEIGVTSSKDLEAMLRLMGYEYYAKIAKTRRIGKVGDVELCIDEVDGLGSFIEVEKLFEDHNADLAAAETELWKVLESLGITHADHETHGYDQLVRAQQDETH